MGVCVDIVAQTLQRLVHLEKQMQQVSRGADQQLETTAIQVST